MLTFRVTGQRLEKDMGETVADKQIDFVRLVFFFSHEWESIDKVVQLVQDESTYHMHIGKGLACQCLLPAEITTGKVEISVFGYDGAVRATTTPLEIRVSRSGMQEDGETPVPPTPDLYAQLLEQIDKKISTVVDGKSAYEIAVDEGFEGTEEEWLASLKGEKGDKGDPGTPGADGQPGKDGADGQDGADGADGKSAYQIWLEAGNSGTEEEFLASLKGEPGESPDVSEIQAAAESAKATAEGAKSIAEAVQADLVSYYRKSETYSQDEVDQMISSIPKFSVAVAATLPSSDISDTTVYLVKSGDEAGNLYTEYIYVGGKWEQLGTQSLDLSGYYTSTQVDGLMGGKVDKVSGKGLSTEDFTTAYKEKLDSIEAGATKIVVDTSLSATSTNPVQNKVLKSALDGKAASSHTHDYLPLDGVANAAAKLQTARGINGVSFDGTAGISVPIYCYQSHLLSGYADTPWVKIADTTITATWESAWIDLFLEGEKGDINHRTGVIRASVVTGAENKVIGASLTWLVASKGLDTSKYALVYREESGTVTAELWYKATKAYDSIAYVSLANGSKYSATNRKWILYSNRNENFLESLPDGTVVYPTVSELRNSQSDTGWVDITLESMFSSSSWLKCRKVGKTVHLQGELCPASTGIPGYTLMLSASLQYPPDTTRILYPINRAGKPMQIQLSAGAGITIFSPESGYTTDSSWIVDTVYFVEE